MHYIKTTLAVYSNGIHAIPYRTIHYILFYIYIYITSHHITPCRIRSHNITLHYITFHTGKTLHAIQTDITFTYTADTLHTYSTYGN